MERFKDRHEAGGRLAIELAAYKGSDAIVLGLPRGGVPVAAEVARALGLPLDVVVVRKVGAPGQPELAMGAVAQGGARFRNTAVVRDLRVSEEEFERRALEQEEEVRQRLRHFRGDLPVPPLSGRTVILVDDGVATGSTILAAARALRTLRPGRLVMAVPVLSPRVQGKLEEACDELVYIACRDDFYAVGQWYRDFSQTPDQEVVRLLGDAQEAPA